MHTTIACSGNTSGAFPQLLSYRFSGPTPTHPIARAGFVQPDARPGQNAGFSGVFSIEASMSQQLKMAVQSGQILTNEQQGELMAAIDSHEQVEALRASVAAFDWKSLLSLLPLITQFIPTIGPIITAILAILKVVPTPNNGSDIPTPVP
jgi:hypothetical protein